MIHKKLISLLALVMTAMTASAVAPAYKIKVGTNEHGTFAFQVNGTDRALQGGEIAADEGDLITLTITPDGGWWVNVPYGEWHAVDAAARQATQTSTWRGTSRCPPLKGTRTLT